MPNKNNTRPVSPYDLGANGGFKRSHSSSSPNRTRAPYDLNQAGRGQNNCGRNRTSSR